CDITEDIGIEEIPAHRSTFRAAEVQIGADQRRPAQRTEDTALRRRFPRNATPYRGTNPRRFRTGVGKPPGERPDQVAIGVEAENLEPGHPAPGEALPVVLQRPFRWSDFSCRGLPYIQQYNQIRARAAPTAVRLRKI